MSSAILTPRHGRPERPEYWFTPTGPRGATPRVRRVAPAVYRRRRLAVLALGVTATVTLLGQAGIALGGVSLAASERRPTSAPSTASAPIEGANEATIEVTVRPGDTLWAIAGRLAPGSDPREAVDAMSRARGGAPLLVGEVLRWPKRFTS
jgi:hypothetical protein